MDASASMKIPLMDREVCANCGHLHRPSLAKKCKCCMADQINLEEFGLIIDV